MTQDIYKVAAQTGLRFSSIKGELTVEQLFHLPLKNANGSDLDSIARSVNNQLKSVTTESFVEEEIPDPRKERLTVSLEILKDVIATKVAEKKAMADRLERSTKRRKILDAIAEKDNQAMTAATKEDLMKQLAELDK